MVLALVSALALSLLFAVSHATAAVHVKAKPHKASVTRKAHAKSKHKKHSKKKVTKDTTSTTSKTTTTESTTTQTSPVTTTASTTSTPSPSSATSSTSSSSTSPSAPSAPSSTPGSNPGSLNGSVLFNGLSISAWPMNQSATPTRVQSVPDPSGVPGFAQQFTTYNTDVAPLTPTVNPRSQLDSPFNIFTSGNQYWESFEVYVPTTQTLPSKGWISLESAVYGAPFAGTPPATISIDSGAFRFQRNGNGPDPYQIAWTTPVVKGQWYRFTWHFDLAANGWIELYVNNVQQQLKYGNTSVSRLPIAMIDSSDNKGPYYSQEQLYYNLGLLPSAQVYFKNYEVGSTQAAAGTSLG